MPPPQRGRNFNRGGRRAAIAHGASAVRDPDRVQVEAGVRPRAYPGGLRLVEQRQAREQPEHGAAERFGESRRVVRAPRDERPVAEDTMVTSGFISRVMPAVSCRAIATSDRDADADVSLMRYRAAPNNFSTAPITAFDCRNSP